MYEKAAKNSGRDKEISASHGHHEYLSFRGFVRFTCKIFPFESLSTELRQYAWPKFIGVGFCQTVYCLLSDFHQREDRETYLSQVLGL